MRIPGKIAVITGAATGIGAAIARRFHTEGAVVYALDLKFSGEMNQKDGLATICADVREQASIDQAIATITRSTPKIDILVNNAGINVAPAPVEQTSAENLEAILGTNLKSIFYVTAAARPYMATGSTIINVASILGVRGVPSCAAYTASKGGILALTRTMAKDYAPEIRVNSISPGAIETAMFDDYLARTENPDEDRERIRREIPMKRLGQPADIAAAALFLASDEAAWITGQNLIVDGGDSI